jgi:hypothetical protein
MRSVPDQARHPLYDLAEKIALIGAIGLISYPAIKRIAGHWRVKHPVALGESAIDKVLKDSYPASDPPASRYVDIPVNRR